MFNFLANKLRQRAARELVRMIETDPRVATSLVRFIEDEGESAIRGIAEYVIDKEMKGEDYVTSRDLDRAVDELRGEMPDLGKLDDRVSEIENALDNCVEAPEIERLESRVSEIENALDDFVETPEIERLVNHIKQVENQIENQIEAVTAVLGLRLEMEHMRPGSTIFEETVRRITGMPMSVEEPPLRRYWRLILWDVELVCGAWQYNIANISEAAEKSTLVENAGDALNKAPRWSWEYLEGDEEFGPRAIHTLFRDDHENNSMEHAAWLEAARA